LLSLRYSTTGTSCSCYRGSIGPFFLGESIKGLQINPELEIQTGVLGYWDFQFKIESLFCLILPLHLLSWQISTSIQIFNYSTETVYPHIHIGHYSVWGSSPDLEEQVPNFLDSEGDSHTTDSGNYSIIAVEQ